MRDYDALINSLKNCVYIPCDGTQKEKCLAGREDDCRRELMAIAANAIEELVSNADKPKWISIEERLPEDLRDVQITVFWHNAWRTMYGFYDGKFWHLYAPMHTEVADVEVVGWMEKPLPMPLPEPPEGNE